MFGRKGCSLKAELEMWRAWRRGGEGTEPEESQEENASAVM